TPAGGTTTGAAPARRRGAADAGRRSDHGQAAADRRGNGDFHHTVCVKRASVPTFIFPRKKSLCFPPNLI
ncbi:MAG: hypothetical protein LIQ30_03210, partial [Planctomycetes bacterium]|nr:hypothetical protein [Planctomycetota bacterium]